MGITSGSVIITIVGHNEEYIDPSCSPVNGGFKLNQFTSFPDYYDPNSYYSVV